MSARDSSCQSGGWVPSGVRIWPIFENLTPVKNPEKYHCLIAATGLPASRRIHQAQPERHSGVQEAAPALANGATKGPCKGYVIDHVKALACNGADAPSNMQWQTVAEAKVKDKWERK